MKSFLHPLFLIVLLLSLPGQAQGQKICGYVDNGYVYELYNHEVARSNTTAYVFNRTFIKSLIGLSPDSIWKHQRMELSDDEHLLRWRRSVHSLSYEPISAIRGVPFVFNGVRYGTLHVYTSLRWKPEFTSVMDLKEHSLARERPDWSCYLLFDDVLLVNDLGSYRFDKDYIDSVVVYRQQEHYDREADRRWWTYEPVREPCPAPADPWDNYPVIFRVFSKDYAKEHAHNAQDSLHPALPRMRTQFEEDANRSAIFLNGTFVGSTFGLNLDSLTRIGGKNPYRVTVTPEPYEAGGVRYASRTDIECKHYRPKLVPLRSLADRFPGIRGPSSAYECPFVVDNVLIANPQNVLIDVDYISVIRGFLGSEIGCFPPMRRTERSYGSQGTGFIQVYVKKTEYLYDLAHPRIR